MKKLFKTLFGLCVVTGAAVSMAAAVYAEDVSIDVSEAAESTNWGQSITIRKDVFDPERITKDTVVQVAYDAGDYDGEELPIELVFQSWNNSTSPNAVNGEVWARVTTDNYTDTTATFTYDAIVEAYGTKDFSEVQAIHIGDTSLAPVTCKGLIFTNCSKAKATINLSLDCSEAKRADSSSASLSVSFETFDMTTLTTKSTITIDYKYEGAEEEPSSPPINMYLQSLKDSNSPYAQDDGTAWVAVEPESYNKKTATFNYNDIVEAYGVADFSKVDYIKFGSPGADIIKVRDVSITECLPADRGTHVKEEISDSSEEASEAADESSEETSATEAAAAQESVASSAAESNEEKKGSNLIFIIIGIVAGVGIAVAVIFIILTKESSQEYDIDKRRMVSKKKPKNKTKW